MNDITKIKVGVVLQQVNRMGVMGCGVALAIRNRWPVVYEKYRKYYQVAQLGMIQIIHIDADLYVVNLFSQHGYGRGKRYTQYDYLETCLKKVYRWWLDTRSDLPIYIPYKMGCSNAGGNWDLVSRIIKQTLPKAKIVNPANKESNEKINQLFKEVVSRNLKNITPKIEF